MKRIEFDYYDWNEFEKFLDSLPTKDVAKLVTIIRKIETYGLLVAERQKWTKKLENNLYEIRSKRASNIQRAIYFQFKDNKYIITNGFTKKSQKTPASEKKIARDRRTLYFKKEES
jgi:phage-related protein